MRTLPPRNARRFPQGRPVFLLRGLWIAASLLVPASPSLADSVIDTTAVWDHVQGVGPFGDNGIETFGQTFVAPAESRLDQITLFVNDSINSGTVFNPAYLDFKAYVMGWSAMKATGPILFQSAQFTTTDNGSGGGMERFDLDTGGIDLLPDGSYVFFISSSGLFDGNRSTGGLGYTGEAVADAYQGGQFVALDNQQDTSRWTIDTWQAFFPGRDLAFTLSFSPVPEPRMGSLGLLFLGSLVLLRRRRGGAKRFTRFCGRG